MYLNSSEFIVFRMRRCESIECYTSRWLHAPIFTARVNCSKHMLQVTTSNYDKYLKTNCQKLHRSPANDGSIPSHSAILRTNRAARRLNKHIMPHANLIVIFVVFHPRDPRIFDTFNWHVYQTKANYIISSRQLCHHRQSAVTPTHPFSICLFLHQFFRHSESSVIPSSLFWFPRNPF